MRRTTASGVISLSVLLMPAVPNLASADPRCQVIEQHVNFGPFDFRDKSAKNRPHIGIVESRHYTREQRQKALAGAVKPPGYVPGNMAYTLRALPNHAGALYHLGVWEVSIRKYHPELVPSLESFETWAPARCYFERAERFAPNDPNVYTAWGRVLHRAGDLDNAAKMFKKVTELAPGSARAHYNLGLAYYAAEQYAKAAESARKAYSLGYSRKELKQRLISKGVWK